MSTRAAVVASANAKDIAESVRKCKNFLSTLMRLACNYNQPEKVVQNVTNLIQDLIVSGQFHDLDLSFLYKFPIFF